MISKENFKKLAFAIRKLQEDRAILADCIENIIDGHAIVTTGDETISDIIDVMSDGSAVWKDYIDWWLFGNVEKKIWLEDGTEINVESIDQLYDFLVKYGVNENEKGIRNI